MTENKSKKDKILDQATIDEIKKDLMARREQVTKELADLSGNGKVDDEYKAKFPNFGDKSDENAQEIGEYTTNLATEKLLEKTLRDIENALDRIEKGTYGICKYCHQPIGNKRLLARPVASACVECKTKLQNSI